MAKLPLGESKGHFEEGTTNAESLAPIDHSFRCIDPVTSQSCNRIMYTTYIIYIIILLCKYKYNVKYISCIHVFPKSAPLLFWAQLLSHTGTLYKELSKKSTTQSQHKSCNHRHEIPLSAGRCNNRPQYNCASMAMEKFQS